MHISRLVQFIFGFEGTLAAKSIKRSSKSYRAMVTAISISIILFLVMRQYGCADDHSRKPDI